MIRSRYFGLATVMTLAVVMGFAAGDALAAAPADQSRTAVTLRIGGFDEPIQATALVGEPISLRDRERGLSIELVPLVQPGSRGSQSRVALEAYEVTKVGQEERSNLVYSTPLDAEGSTLVFSGNQTLEVELVEIRQVEVVPILAPDPDGLRPTQCCLGCPGGPVVCGFCVELPCGRCCLF